MLLSIFRSLVQALVIRWNSRQDITRRVDSTSGSDSALNLAHTIRELCRNTRRFKAETQQQQLTHDGVFSHESDSKLTSLLRMYVYHSRKMHAKSAMMFVGYLNGRERHSTASTLSLQFGILTNCSSNERVGWKNASSHDGVLRFTRSRDSSATRWSSIWLIVVMHVLTWCRNDQQSTML